MCVFYGSTILSYPLALYVVRAFVKSKAKKESVWARVRENKAFAVYHYYYKAFVC